MVAGLDDNTILSTLVLNQRQAILNNLIEIDKSKAVAVFPGERQQVVNNPGNPVTLADDSIKEEDCLGPIRKIIGEELGEIDNAVDRVIDFMGDSRRQFTQGRQLGGADRINFPNLIAGQFAGNQEELRLLPVKLAFDGYDHQGKLATQTREPGVFNFGRTGL